MKEIKRALVAGSFDPPTLGHYDLAVRAAAIFDEVYVVALVNTEKQGRFSGGEKLLMLQTACAEIPNIHCDVSTGLLAGYAAEHGIQTLVKGARGAVDFDYELTLSQINRSVEPGLDTVIFPSKPEYSFISSTMVSEMIKYGRDYSNYVPAGVAEIIRKITDNS